MVFHRHSKVNCSCATFKHSLNLFCVPVLAHEEVLNALLFSHVYLASHFDRHSKVNFSCATFKPSKLLNLFCVPVLAHEEVLSALVCYHVLWLHTLTSIHNVLVPNIAKRAGKGCPAHKDKPKQSH